MHRIASTVRLIVLMIGSPKSETPLRLLNRSVAIQRFLNSPLKENPQSHCSTIRSKPASLAQRS